MMWTVAALQGAIALLLSRAIGNNVPVLAMLALWVPYVVVMALIRATMVPH